MGMMSIRKMYIVRRKPINKKMHYLALCRAILKAPVPKHSLLQESVREMTAEIIHSRKKKYRLSSRYLTY